MIEIPESFEISCLRAFGEAGERWSKTLPGVLATLMHKWKLDRDGELVAERTSVMMPVRRDDEVFALKISHPEPESTHEVLALRTWDGAGAIKLFDAEPHVNAVLLERLDSLSTLSSVDVEDATNAAGQMLRRLAVAPPKGLPKLQDIADSQMARLHRTWEGSERFIPERQMEIAIDWLESYYPVNPAIMVHIDLAFGNVFAATREPWLATNPKVISGDLEYSLAPMFWSLSPRDLSASFNSLFKLAVDAAEVDFEAARQWTIVRTIAYWLAAWQQGLTDEPVKAAHIVDALCG